MDLACLPAPVVERLALAGYWTCDPHLRDRLGRWDDLDKQDQAVTGEDVGLLASVLAR